MSWQRGWGEMTPGTDARPVSRARMVSLSQGELGDLIDAARVRGFWRGVAVAAMAVLGLVAGVAAARAETISIGRTFINGSQAGGTTVSIAPSDRPGELAVITLENRHVNDGGDTAVYPLAMGDVVAVLVEFTWDADPVLGSDRITVTPPQGVTCEPADCTATVLEGLTGQVILIDWRGM